MFSFNKKGLITFTDKGWIMLKCLILLSFIGVAFGQWRFNIFEVDENGGPGEVVVDVSFCWNNYVCIVRLSSGALVVLKHASLIFLASKHECQINLI